MPYKVLTIDGNWLARSRFEAVRGEEDDVFQCVEGFLKRVGDLTAYFEPETVVVAWDSTNSARKRKLPSYKAQRQPAPKGFTDALRQIKKLLRGKGAYQFESKGWEGDDVIATVVRTMPGPHVIFSVDKDLYQLVNDNVSFYRALGDGMLFTSENIEEETGLTAEGWTSYLSLMGDAADNLKGVPGVGDVSARLVLEAYPGIVEDVICAEQRPHTLELVEATGEKKVISIVKKCVDNHRSLTETWLAVQLQTVKLEVTMPEAV